MEFFDFNVPFLERGSPQIVESQKSTRLKIAVKAMELGYSGIAYNLTVRGKMSESDRCTIHAFPLSSLLKLAPTISTAVKFHRELLGARPDAPFRQYTRLTVAVDNSILAAALNSGNPVLKTYDLVAIMPLSQTAFDQACKVSEVDLIAIDFSQKLPFRLKQPMIKAAIERGIHFEITYSPLVSNIQLRRQMVSSAKLLVDWTRGKNLIFSSAAPTANELRGPYDVANLSSLLGLSMERAKAAISRNCRSLIFNALRKKQFFKEAIKVERISEGEPFHAGNWDPISGGDGDLSLDDIAKSVFSAKKMNKSVNWCQVSFQSSSAASAFQFLAKENVSPGSTKDPLISSDSYGITVQGKSESKDQHAGASTTGTVLSSGLDNIHSVNVADKEQLSNALLAYQTSEIKGHGADSGNGLVCSFGVDSSPGAKGLQLDDCPSRSYVSNGASGRILDAAAGRMTTSAKLTSHSKTCHKEIRLNELKKVFDPDQEKLFHKCDMSIMNGLAEGKEREQNGATLADSNGLLVKNISEVCEDLYEDHVAVSIDGCLPKGTLVERDEHKEDTGSVAEEKVENGRFVSNSTEPYKDQFEDNVAVSVHGFPLKGTPFQHREDMGRVAQGTTENEVFVQNTSELYEGQNKHNFAVPIGDLLPNEMAVESDMHAKDIGRLALGTVENGSCQMQMQMQGEEDTGRYHEIKKRKPKQGKSRLKRKLSHPAFPFPFKSLSKPPVFSKKARRKH